MVESICVLYCVIALIVGAYSFEATRSMAFSLARSTVIGVFWAVVFVLWLATGMKEHPHSQKIN
jgi:hypothetical protein